MASGRVKPIDRNAFQVKAKAVGSPGYNEYKFQVTPDNLGYVRQVLEEFYGGSDPFPEGVVDSIYFDSIDGRMYDQCANGEPHKIKFRIRGYGDNTFRQLHRKEKDLFGVSKLKARIAPVTFRDLGSMCWQDIRPAAGGDWVFSQIMAMADQYGPLVPVVRVRYYRYRYRVNDYRITLDTNVEVMGFSNGFDRACAYGVLPGHVLEVKTPDPRPHLPLLGLTRLQQISFSKFYLGCQTLRFGRIA